jgi:GrpB-like predicted nucleotidyltransferase (UPF0157 family)
VNIEVVASSKDWPDRFVDFARELRATLAERALRIDHIGSTAVPGLAAKDIIDVQVTVTALDEAALRPHLEALGLAWRGDIRCDHHPPGTQLDPDELCKLYAGNESTHCHIRVAGRFNQRYALLCRDYLRSHPAAAAAYGEIKRQLARHLVDDVDAYYDVKDPVCDLILEGAHEWAARTGWQPGPSDA